MSIHQGISMSLHGCHRAAGQLLLIMFCFLSLHLFAQVDQRLTVSWKPYVLGTEQGLSSNFCYALAQDRKGFLWIATHDGLNRYDGYEFRVYRHNPSDPHSLPGNTITAVQVDNRNRVWVIADGMLAVFDPEKERFDTMRYPELANAVRQIFVTPEGYLLVAGNTSVLVNLDNLKPVVFGLQSLLPGAEQQCARNVYYGISSRGQLLAVQTCGRLLHWFSFNPANKHFQMIRSFTIAQPESLITPITSATTDRHGRLHLVFSGYQPLVLDARDSLVGLQPSPWTAVHILEDQEAAMFYSTESGLFVRQADTQKMQWPGKLSTVIPSEVIRQGFQDQTGMLWFAGSKGIFRVDPKQRHVWHFGKKISKLVDDFVLSLVRMPDGRICVDYFGQQQFTMIDPLKGQVSHLAQRDRRARDWVVHAILKSGSRLPPGNVVDVLTHKFQLRQISPEVIRGIIADSSANAWIVVFNTLRHSDSDQTLSLPEMPNDVKSDGEVLWLAFPGQGLWRFDPGSRQLSRVLAGKMASGDITSILPADSGALWIGTKGAGIYRFVPRTGAYSQYTTEQGLAHNSVYCMTRDGYGRLWVGTANGLSCMDPKQPTFRQFFKGHGFANTEYNRHSAITLEDGRIAVGGMNGIDLFDPDSITFHTRETTLQLTDVKVHSVSRGVRALYRLNHDEHMVSIHFAVMDYRQPEKNQFKYQLSNADTGWIMLGSRNTITFDFLEPGAHTIRIRGANSDGVWSKQDLTLRLDVQPAWYQRWWFYLLVAALAAGLGYLWFTYRLHQKLQVYRVRQRIHRDLHDDVGATLSSVKAYAEILKEHPDNPVIPALISENAADMIERLEVISWAADPGHDHISSLRNRMVKFATPICHAKSIDFSLSMEGLDENQEVPGEIRQHLFMVFKEAIHNMDKYADARRCEVNLGVVGRNFIMRIRDDGRGTDGIIRGTGQGWKNMETRAKELDGSVQFGIAPGQGTEIRFSIRYPFSIPNSWGRKEP
jgi:ligand-binding sensor domain-containing protein